MPAEGLTLNPKPYTLKAKLSIGSGIVLKPNGLLSLSRRPSPTPRHPTRDFSRSSGGSFRRQKNASRLAAASEAASPFAFISGVVLDCGRVVLVALNCSIYSRPLCSERCKQRGPTPPLSATRVTGITCALLLRLRVEICSSRVLPGSPRSPSIL